MNIRRVSPFLAIGCLVLLPAGLFCQTGGQPAPTPTLKVSTTIVVLDVVVTDKKGNLVLDRKRDDFTVIEDKVGQTIRSFDPPSAHALPAAVVVNGTADLQKIGDAPVTILVLDELNTRFEDMTYSRNAMVKYLEAQPKALTQPTVLLLASNTRFVQLHDYTQDRDALIDQIRHHMPEYPSKMMAGKGGAAVERMAQTLASLEQIAQASSGTPGRKNVIWVGNGFPSVGLVGLDQQTADTIQGAVKQCTDRLLAARVTMYTINPTLNSTVTVDIQTPDDLETAETENGGDPFGASISFATLAPATGGRSFLSRNDINNEIAEGISAGANYYTLSYTPTNHSEDAAKYRNIRVVMKDPDLHAVTRDGYYPETAATTNPTIGETPKLARNQLELDLSSAVNSAISYNGLLVSAAKTASGGYELRVKPAAMEWRAANGTTEQTEATVMAAWYDGKGKLLGHAAKELTATRPAGTEPAKAPDAIFAFAAAIPPGYARLRFVVRDAVNGRMGTVDLGK
jgi:VWFA-related protein